MGKIIAAINSTLDGICDHTAGITDEEIHRHYTKLLEQADAILYGRKTYQLMEYWRSFITNPSEEKSMQAFALAIHHIPKVVFSNGLEEVAWESATLANSKPEDIVSELKQRCTKDILVGSRSLIIQLMNLNLIDEFQLCIHPVVAGHGLPLFEHIKERTVFNLSKTKRFDCGAILLYYEPQNA